METNTGEAQYGRELAILETERRRIAADLHDGLGQSLGLVVASLALAASLVHDGEPQRAAQCLAGAQAKAREALDELRRIAMNLRPATLDSLGLLATLSWHLRELEAARPGLRIERRLAVAEADVPERLRTPIYRIVQEACSNALKHGDADRITVRLAQARGALELAIEDNGRGCDPAALMRAPQAKHGLGLRSMQERAAHTRGRCEVRSAPGKGTRICVRWPASPPALVALSCAADTEKAT